MLLYQTTIRYDKRLLFKIKQRKLSVTVSVSFEKKKKKREGSHFCAEACQRVSVSVSWMTVRAGPYPGRIWLGLLCNEVYSARPKKEMCYSGFKVAETDGLVGALIG